MTLLRWKHKVSGLLSIYAYMTQNYGRLRYVKKRREEGLTQKEIAALLGVTTSRIKQLLDKHDKKRIISEYPKPYDVFLEFKQHYDEVIDNER